MEPWLQTLGESSLRAIAVAAGIAAILRGLRIKSPAARHAAWTGALAAMLALPLATAWLPQIPLRVLPRRAVASSGIVPVPNHHPGPAPAALPVPSGAPTPTSPPWRSRRSDVAAVLYLLPLAVLLLRLIAGTVQAQLLIRHARRRGALLESGRCAAPVTVGLFRPEVLLPVRWETWPVEKLDATLAHEHEHVRRLDPLIQWVAALNRSIFWFHPLAWWIEYRLAALAEEACDDAVLARGYEPLRYADFLLEFASTAARAGGRVALRSAGIQGRVLPRRIHRILKWRDETPTRPRLSLCASLCAAVVLSGIACRLERRESRAPGQPTMNELMHRAAAESRQRAERQSALLEEAARLSPEEARALETKVRNDPQDEPARTKLLAYYEFKKDVKGRSRIVLWAIEHQPATHLAAASIDPAADREGYERGKQLWLRHVGRATAGADVFSRAATFVKADDKSLAERILLSGRGKYPNESRWPMLLGQLYYEVLVGSTGPLQLGVVRTVSLRDAHGAYADEVRRKLAESRDPALLTRTGQMLTQWGMQLHRRGVLDFDPFPLGASYVERALALNPDFGPALAVRADLDSLESYRENEAIFRGRSPEEALKHAADSERLALLPRLMKRTYWLGNTSQAESHARDLLALIARFPKHPRYGDLVFDANILLGKVALRNGDRKKAARHLLAAAETPGSDRLRYSPISMELPRSLVDWGEREAVARFLERCARFNRDRDRLTRWAADLRNGINPDLIPYETGCAQEPC